MIGYEAGQSAFGDVFAWLRKMLAWPARASSRPRASPRAIEDKLLPALEAEAAKIDPASPASWPSTGTTAGARPTPTRP